MPCSVRYLRKYPRGGVIYAIKDVCKGYWFLHAYVALMFFAPMINTAIAYDERSNKRQALAIGLPIVVSVFGWNFIATRFAMFDIPFPHVHGFESHTWVTLLAVYVAARLCRIYEIDKRLPQKWCIIAILLMAALNNFHYGVFGGYNSLIALVMVVCAFCLVKSIKVESKFCERVCSFVGPSIFAIYLIHQSPLGRDLINTLGAYRADIPIPQCIQAFIFGLLVFCASFIFDLPRRGVVALMRYFVMKRKLEG